MKLSQLIKGLENDAKEEIAVQIGFPGAGQELERLFRSDDAVRKIGQSLFDTEHMTLEVIVRVFGYAPFDWPKLEKAGFRGMSGAALKVGLIRLCRKGIVFALRRKWGEPDYVLPEDTFPYWRQLLAQVREEEWSVSGNEITEHSPFRPSFNALLLAVLAYAVKQHVQVTHKGMLHKRHAGKLSAIVDINDEELAAAELAGHLNSGFGSAGVGCVLGAAEKLGLLERRDERLGVRASELEKWLHVPPDEAERQLYGLWKEMFGLHESWIQHAADSMEKLPEGNWIALPQLLGMLARTGWIAAGADCSMDAGRLQGWARSLAAWGWGEIGSTADGTLHFRWRNKPKSDRTDTGAEDRSSAGARNIGPSIFVQPDFELIVPPDCLPSVRWELEMIAERVRLEQITVYRLTRETFMEAMERGKTSQETLAFLERQAKYGVPDHVKESIAEWGEKKSQLRLEQGLVLRCRDEATAELLAGDEKIAPLLGEALGPKAWLIEPGHAAALRALLERSGYCPGADGRVSASHSALPSDVAASADGGDEPPANEKGLIYSKATVQYYDIERKFPLLEDIYPGLQQIPSMWLKDCRVYHVSTRKQMIQKALELKACLKLRRAGGETLLIPLRMDGIRDDWALTGFEHAEEVRLTPDQWEEMQLILPGVND